MQTLALLWRVPFFALSLLFYRALRLLLRAAARRAAAKRAADGAPAEWHGLSEMLAKPLALPYLMVSAPRWNCQAVVASTGPFAVRSEIEVDLRSLRASAATWGLEIAAPHVPGAALHLGPGAVQSEAGAWHRVALEPQVCRLVLRYYGASGAAEFPAVKVDGNALVGARSARHEAASYAAYLEMIRNRSGVFYYCLHYYMRCLLRWQSRLRDAFVRSEYVPAANPGTLFRFGRLERGAILRVEVAEEFVNKALVDVVYYNRCSFPVAWERITGPSYRGEPATVDGSYLVRVNGLDGDGARCGESAVACNTTTETGKSGD